MAGSSRSRSILVGTEAALALVLLVGAGLLVRSYRALERTDLGFAIDRVVTFEVALPSSRYPEPAQRGAFLRGSLERLRSLPGVRAAAVTSGLPLTPVNTASTVEVNGRAPEEGQPRAVTFRLVGDGYFETLGIPVLAGRSFAEGAVVMDTGEARVAAVNRTFVERFLDGAEHEALEASLRLPALGTADLRVVAVVGDVHEFGPASPPRPTVYVPVASSASSGFALRVEGEPAVDPSTLFDDVRAALAELDPEQPAHAFRTFDSAAERWLGTPAFQSSLMTLFAALALVLASVGVFGAVGQAVRERTRELGLRLALGAQPAQLLQALLGRLAMALGAGMVAGLGGSLALSRLLRGSLHGVGPGDPATYLVALASIVAVGTAAAALPARRALAVAPSEALRDS
jgi:putative ABC transport system permease protein